MANTSEATSIEQATPQEVTEMIGALEQYRERLMSDTLEMAQRAKVKKSKALASLEPQLAEIDGMLQTLRQRQTVLTASN